MEYNEGANPRDEDAFDDVGGGAVRHNGIPPPQSMRMVRAGAYYSTYYGHACNRLDAVLEALRHSHRDASCLFLAGDSTMDNKVWLFPGMAQSAYVMLGDSETGSFTAPAINGYERVLQPPRMVMDVTYWLNHFLAAKQAPAFALNTAVEATTLTSRTGGVQCCCAPACPRLYRQDAFIRDRIRPQDYLITCVGGNDIALAPSIFTVAFLILMMLTPWFLLIPCHPSVLYFKMMFHYQMKCYVKRLVARVKPKKIAICMVYNLDEANVDSWANCALCALCYGCAPGMLQFRMRLAFILGVSRIRIAGTTVVPVALADALDGKDTRDYHQRVEPSVQGGRKIARLILSKLGLLDEQQGAGAVTTT